MPEKVLIFGSNGQIGTVLTQALVDKHGRENVLATDIRQPNKEICPFEILDVTDSDGVSSLIKKFAPTRIYHLAALLSAKGEQNIELTWKVNVGGFLNVLEGAKANGVDRVFFPSTIAVFGDTTPKINTPQASPLLPTTVYGMSKVTGENWSNYYHKRFGLDVRSLRYPGVIGYQSIPEGGTTDYAVEIFHGALKDGEYTSFLGPDTRLPMIYMPDAIKATLDLMDAEPGQIGVRYSYNLTGMSFTPSEIAAAIKELIPNFEIRYEPDFRQDIAASWTESINDSTAKEDWNWQPDYDLKGMCADMLKNLKHLY